MVWRIFSAAMWHLILLICLSSHQRCHLSFLLAAKTQQSFPLQAATWLRGFLIMWIILFYLLAMCIKIATFWLQFNANFMFIWFNLVFLCKKWDQTSWCLLRQMEMIRKKAMHWIGLGVKKRLLQHRRKNLKHRKKHSRKCNRVMWTLWTQLQVIQKKAMHQRRMGACCAYCSTC